MSEQNVIDECHEWLDKAGFQKIDNLIDADGNVAGQMEIELDDRVYYIAKEWKRMRDALNILGLSDVADEDLPFFAERIRNQILDEAIQAAKTVRDIGFAMDVVAKLEALKEGEPHE